MFRKILIIMLVIMIALPMMANVPAPMAGSLATKTLTIVNKSGGPIAVKLVPATSVNEGFLYVEVPSGTKEVPFTQAFSVVANEYYFFVYYWKEVHKYDSSSSTMKVSKTQQCLLGEDSDFYYDAPIIDLTKNYKRVILPCNGPEPTNYGEPNMDKFWYSGYIELIDKPWYQPVFDWVSYYVYE